MRETSALAVVRIRAVGPQGSTACTQYGTGFFVSPSGAILTAAHVVPPCATQIDVAWIDASGRLSPDLKPARVEVRDDAKTRDVALLRLEEPPEATLAYIEAEAFGLDHRAYKDRCTLIASHFSEQYDVETSYAEIATLMPVDENGWKLRGDGFNPSRSGSPIILNTGTVIGILLSRSEGARSEQSAESAIRDRATFRPLFEIDPAIVDLASLRAEGGPLQPLKEVHIGALPVRAASRFGVSETLEPGGDGTPVALRNGKVIYRGGLLGALASSIGGSSGREEWVERRFTAMPGYRFDPATFRLEIASYNPPGASIPEYACAERANDLACYALEDDGRTLALRFALYPGLVDGRRSWVDMEIVIEQIPE